MIDLIRMIYCLPSTLKLLMKAANGDVYEESFEALKSSVYSSDISFEKLHQELPLLVTFIRQPSFIPFVKL